MKVTDCIIAPAGANLPNIAGVAFTEPAIASTGYCDLNAVIQQGAAFYQRIGQKINIKMIEAHITLICTAAPTQAWFRLMIVHDRSPNGVAPGMADILFSQPAAGISSNSMLSVVNKARFSVIYEKRDDMINTDNTYITEINVRKHVNITCHYGANAGNIGDIRSGALYLICFTQAAAGGLNYAAGSAHVRMSFYDL